MYIVQKNLYVLVRLKMTNRYVIVSETRGIIAHHADLKKIKAWRIEEEAKHNEHCNIFQEVEE